MSTFVSLRSNKAYEERTSRTKKGAFLLALRSLKPLFFPDTKASRARTVLYTGFCRFPCPEAAFRAHAAGATCATRATCATCVTRPTFTAAGAVPKFEDFEDRRDDLGAKQQKLHQDWREMAVN